MINLTNGGGVKEIITDSIFNSNEIKGVCEKKKIYKDDILNCAGIQKNMSSKTKLLKVDDLFNIEDGSLASDNSEDGEFDFITGAEEWKKHSEYTHEKEALIYVVSAGGSLGRSHYVNGKFIASNLCLILTPKNNDKYPLNLQFYSTYLNNLRKKIVSDLADGTSKLTIGKPNFKQYYIDYIPIEKQNDFVEKHIKEYNKKLKSLKKMIKEAEDNIASNMRVLL